MVYFHNVILFLQLFLSGATAIKVTDLFYCGFEQDRDFCGIKRTGRWVRESLSLTEGTGPQGNTLPNVGNGAKGTNYFALMDAENNEADELVSMIIDVESACRFRVDFFVYLYGKDVRLFMLQGFNQVNGNWEPFLEYDRIGPLLTPSFVADDEFLKTRNNDSDGVRDWRNLWVQTNHHAMLKLVCLNSKDPAKYPHADIAVDEINIEVAWCPREFQTTTPGQVTRYTGLPTGATRRTTITPEGTILNIDASFLPAFGNDFGGAYNSDLDDTDWSLGSASVFFQSSPPEHSNFLYVKDENLVAYGAADLILPPIPGTKCLILYYRLFQSPVMALYVMYTRAGVDLVADEVVISDPSELFADWSKLSIEVDAQDGDKWFLRAMKQDLGQTFRRGGHIEVDDITAHLDSCDIVNEAKGAIPRDGTRQDPFRLPRPPGSGVNAAAATGTKEGEAEEDGALAAAIIIPVLIVLLAGILLFVIVRNKKGAQQPSPEEGGFDQGGAYAGEVDAGGQPVQGGQSAASLGQGKQSGTAVQQGASGTSVAQPGARQSQGSFGGQMVSAAGESVGASGMVSAAGGSVDAGGMVSADGGSFGGGGMVSAADDNIVAQVPEE